MKRFKLLTSLFFLSVLLLGFGVAEDAFALKKIGDACTESNECESNTCDDSYCTCGDTAPSNHCAQAYGGTAANWKCVDEDEDPDSSREEWNFCKKSDYLSSLPKTSTADVKYPVEKKLLMGQPCIDVDACLSGNGHGIDVCNETKLDSSPTPGDPLYDPWYVPGKKLNICTPPPDSMRAPDMCEYQYGTGDWDWNMVADTAGLELRGMRVCKKNGSPIMTTLAEMRKSAVKDVNSVETTFLGFDISMEAPELVTPATKIG
ncbi:MAG TPA: hypothetical protein PK295_02300, partial [Candidatus Magasanikbacteria bacterium]|nr:hypothetical protein [Candidatus Magasanikbacteria bacterium]